MKNILFIILITLIFGFSCNKVNNVLTDNNLVNPNSMQITSNAFENNKDIPSQYTCDGSNTNPPLNFVNVPMGAKSLALIVDDPDAPAGTWVHWLVYNIEPSTTSLNENSVPLNSSQGLTSFGTAKWGGPCPPSGTHRYFFKLYALDIILNTNEILDANKFNEFINNHIIDKAELIGLYNR